MAIAWTPPTCAKLPRTCKEAWQGGLLPSVVYRIGKTIREWVRTLSLRVDKHRTGRGLVDRVPAPRLGQTWCFGAGSGVCSTLCPYPAAPAMWGWALGGSCCRQMPHFLWD